LEQPFRGFGIVGRGKGVELEDEPSEVITKLLVPEFKSNVFCRVVSAVQRAIGHPCVRCDLRESKTINAILGE
jgi:hypothetical protein